MFGCVACCRRMCTWPFIIHIVSGSFDSLKRCTFTDCIYLDENKFIGMYLAASAESLQHCNVEGLDAV
jgi:hypothetical protein